MAFAWLCVLSFILLIAGTCNATDYDILDFSLARRHELWMAEYGKVYKDDAEKAMRFEIFKENVKYVEDHNNAGTYSNTLAVNQFADLTTQEVVDSYTGFKIPDKTEFVDDFSEPLNVTAFPSSVDWRTQGAVSPVKESFNCSCCWAFTAVETVEGLVKIKTNVLYELSIQQLVDCDMDNEHCDPGDIYVAYKYIQRKGLTTFVNYPYTGVLGTCNTKEEAAPVVAIRGYRWVMRNNEQQLMAAVAQQPVAVGIDVSKDFILHKKGIFRGSCGMVPNHAVTVVGYGEEGGVKFWIVKNSWGTKWADSGFGKMEREVAPRQGLCAIAESPLYPVM